MSLPYAKYLSYTYFQDMDTGDTVEQRNEALKVLNSRRESYDEARKTTASRREAWKRDIMLCQVLDDMDDATLMGAASPSSSRIKMEY